MKFFFLNALFLDGWTLKFRLIYLKEMLRPIPVALASCTRFFEAMSAMGESFATLQNYRVGPTSRTTTPSSSSVDDSKYFTSWHNYVGFFFLIFPILNVWSRFLYPLMYLFDSVKMIKGDLQMSLMRSVLLYAMLVAAWGRIMNDCW